MTQISEANKQEVDKLVDKIWDNEDNLLCNINHTELNQIVEAQKQLI